MMHKKVALNAHRIVLKGTVKPLCINNAFSAYGAIRHLFGKRHITKFHAGGTGLSYGLPKATALGSYALCLITAALRSGVSKITGLTKCLKNAWDIKSSNTLSMMPRIFIKMAVC
jgi:hypothetical protein